jgi:hypothetical protein
LPCFAPYPQASVGRLFVQIGYLHKNSLPGRGSCAKPPLDEGM